VSGPIEIGDTLVLTRSRGQGLVTVQVTVRDSLIAEENPVYWGKILLGGKDAPAGHEMLFLPSDIVQHLHTS
jgi:hypothetical protein